MRSEKFLECFNIPYVRYTKKIYPDYYVFSVFLTKEFFAEWGEIWHLELWSPTPKDPVGVPCPLSTSSSNYLLIETEKGKTQILLPNKGSLVNIDKLVYHFPHNLNENTPIFDIKRMKAIKRSKPIEMPSVQQNPF